MLDAKHGRSVLNIVFDLGGVVLSWDPATIVASVFDDDRDRKLIVEGVFAHPDWTALDCGTLSRNEAVDRAVARTHIAPAKLHALFEAIPRALVPVSSTLELITQVREAGNRLYVLSNLHRTSFECVRSTYTVFDLFDGWIVSCEVGMCKPAPAIYRRLLDDFELDPAATVFVDDMPANVDAAAKLGIGTILFRDVASCRGQLQSLGCI